jgi:hypothetical protein
MSCSRSLVGCLEAGPNRVVRMIRGRRHPRRGCSVWYGCGGNGGEKGRQCGSAHETCFNSGNALPHCKHNTHQTGPKLRRVLAQTAASGISKPHATARVHA